MFDDMPRLNKELCEGLAWKQAEEYEKYIEEVIRCAASIFPKGFKFVGSRRATPEEHFKAVTRPKKFSPASYDLAPTDMYAMAYHFEFEGVPAKVRYLLLPYVRRGGVLRIKGACYKISPVLADNLFSPDTDVLYVPVTRSKLKFHRLSVTYVADGVLMSTDTVHCPVINMLAPKRHKKRVTTLMHYMMCNKGLSGALLEYFQVHAVVGEHEINSDSYPTDHWVICSSRGVHPIRANLNYTPSSIRIAIPKLEFTSEVHSAIGGIFYIIDHEPELITVDQVENILLWRRLIPRFAIAKRNTERHEADLMEAHFDSIGHYIDELVKRRLVKENIDSRDIYEFFAVIEKTFTERAIHADPADTSNKKMETTRFVLFDVVKTIFNAAFVLKGLEGPRLSLTNIEHKLNKAFITASAMKMNRKHGEVEVVSSPTDLLPISVTRGLVPQSKTVVTGKSAKDKEMTSRARALHWSQALTSGFCNITSADPSGRSSINHFCQLDESWDIVVPEEAKRELAVFSRMIEE